MERPKNPSNSRPEWVKWYKNANWHRLRHSVLSREPLCRFCKKKGIITEATVADHINPHRGDEKKFYDINNLQSLCKPCHDGTKKKMEASGDFGCDESGFVPGWR